MLTYLREIDTDEQAALDAEAALDERYGDDVTREIADRDAERAPGEKPTWRTRFCTSSRARSAPSTSS